MPCCSVRKRIGPRRKLGRKLRERRQNCKYSPRVVIKCQRRLSRQHVSPAPLPSHPPQARAPAPDPAAAAALPLLGFVVGDKPAVLYWNGMKSSELDRRAAPKREARGERVAVVIAASSGRFGPGRYVVATGVIEDLQSYVATQATYAAHRRSHRGRECGYPFRARMRMWPLGDVLPLPQPVRIHTFKSCRRWTPIEPIYTQ